MVLPPAVTAHLQKAAERAQRVAHGDAGLEPEVEAPKHPGKRTQEALEKAKESSRSEWVTDNPRCVNQSS